MVHSVCSSVYDPSRFPLGLPYRMFDCKMCACTSCAGICRAFHPWWEPFAAVGCYWMSVRARLHSQSYFAPFTCSPWCGRAGQGSVALAQSITLWARWISWPRRRNPSSFQIGSDFCLAAPCWNWFVSAMSATSLSNLFARLLLSHMSIPSSSSFFAAGPAQRQSARPL